MFVLGMTRRVAAVGDGRRGVAPSSVFARTLRPMRAPHDTPSAGGPTVVTEARVRHSLRGALLASAPTAETIYEFWVPQTNERADVAVIGDLLYGFEIKTERDSLKRLPRQADAYTRVFDRCHVVVAPCHLDRAAEMLPPWWGVLVIEGDLSMTVLREAETNACRCPDTGAAAVARRGVFGAVRPRSRTRPTRWPVPVVAATTRSLGPRGSQERGAWLPLASGSGSGANPLAALRRHLIAATWSTTKRRWCDVPAPRQ